MIRVVHRDYVPPSKRGGTGGAGSADHAQKQRDMAKNHIRRFQQWAFATEFMTLYTKGARVWVPHQELVWEGAEVIQDYTGKILKVRTEDGNEVDLSIASDDTLPPLRNPDILIGENDLTSLSYLHEPAVLYNLQVRFCGQNTIYTYCGIVLVAINPYDDLPIYGADTIWAYRGQAMGDLEPHIFAVAEEAFTKLEREARDQSIIVSGESGAGKTVSAKYAMRYFATVGGSATETQVEKKVLASSPIMEAIGNAKTTRNDNSSRFGKFIEIRFGSTAHIHGASMRTYLLEKSRVVFQAPDERNYHIFYQMCAARDSLAHLNLLHQDEFHYTNQGESAAIDGVDDAQTFLETCAAFSLLGFTQREQEDVLKVLAAVLHLGNVVIEEAVDETDADGEACDISPKDKHLLHLAALLQLDAASMRAWLCQRKIVSMREVFLKPMTVKEAVGARDALAKHVYAQLFDWIVSIVNQALETSDKKASRFIGVLDIYGFETFDTNSFEQFCINYANEKLQQQFNQHVFKLEQEEYLKEKIEWKFIDFYDNQPCIDLIETKLGVLDLLDDECRMPKGTDASWTEKLYKNCASFKHFARPRFGTTAFVIHHFADNVTYQSAGFLEKNRDTVLEDQVEVIRNGKNELIRKLFTMDGDTKLRLPGVKVKVSASAGKQATATAKQNKKTVGSQFGDSLNALMATLNATTPHYVRCIKPNDDKKAFEYNPMRAVQQLRACGVLETIRISAAGFPSRLTYADFFHRYRVLCRSSDISRDNMRATCERILANTIGATAEDKYKFGASKIFFRAGQVAYLEKLRAERLRACCITMQRHVRGFIARKKYLRTQSAVATIQRHVRGFIARRRVYHLRRLRAAITIQRYVRGWVKRRQYRRSRACVTRLQARCRGYLARLRFMQLKYNAKAIVIQTAMRGWLARRMYARNKQRVVIVQSAVRRFLARRLFKKLRTEARSVEHVKKLNVGLENKIISLQHKIGELTKEMATLRPAQVEVVDLRSRVETLKTVEVELRRSTAQLSERDLEMECLRTALEVERAEKMDLVTEKERGEKRAAEDKERADEDIKRMKTEIEDMNARIKDNKIGAEELLKARVDEEKAWLNQEHDQDRGAYQKLLTEYNLLEQRSEGLEREVARLQRDAVVRPAGAGDKGHHRSSSNASTASATSELPDDDFGYGSVRSASSAGRQPLDNIDWSASKSSSDVKIEDVGLVLKLQQKLKTVERERARLQERVEHLEKDDSPSDYASKTEDGFRLQELEMENSKLKIDLEALRIAIGQGDSGGAELINQFDALQDELDRRREECIQLHSVLANQTQGLKNVASSNYASRVDNINEDGELVMAFEAQKKINRQLEDELQAEKSRYKSDLLEYKTEITQIRDDNDRQQRLLAANLTTSPLTQTEAFMQHEITRLTSENLDLQEKFDNMSEMCRKLKKQIRLMTKKMKEAGVVDTVDEPVPPTHDQRSEMAVVRKKERDYEGMFEYRIEDEQLIVRHLIHDLKPRLAITLLPGLPSYILFMCVRHTDFLNDDLKVRSLLTAWINTVKRVVKKRRDDLETKVLWLANTLRLLHNLKQYSGDKAFQAENTPKQNQQCLRNFDLAEYRQVLSDNAVWIYQGVISSMEEKVQPMVVPAVLEHEAISGLSGQKPGGGMRARAASVQEEPGSPQPIKPLDQLLQELSSFHRCLGFHGVDPQLIVQVFRQLFYFICASALNNLLLRKDLCHWTKGMQIRYNLSHLEQWARDARLTEPDVTAPLQPVVQAAQLLQARKTDEDVQSVCDMCDKLSMFQIIKILNLYTPADEFEERVPVAFIRRIQATLQDRVEPASLSKLLMDTTFSFPVRFPFNPSNIRLEDIDIPDSLNIPMLKKI